MTRWFCAVFVLPVVWLLLAAGPASAGCTIVGVQSVTPTTLNVGTYTSTTAPPPASISLDVVVSLTGNGIGSCQGSYGLVRPSAPAQMSRVPSGPVALPYSVTNNGTSLLSFGPTATTVRPTPSFNAPNGTSIATFSVLLTITPLPLLGTPPAGSYLDQFALQVFDIKGNKSVLAGQVPLTVSASVVHSCYLAAPSNITLNFTPDVASGIPAGSVQSTSFNVNCTAPSRVRLSGSALTKPASGASSALFDELINYRAVANFSGASATLITSGTSPVTNTSLASSTAGGTALPVQIDINLLAGKPLIGGATYSGVLRVIVDPAL